MSLEGRGDAAEDGGVGKGLSGRGPSGFWGAVDHKKPVLSRIQEHDANRQGAWQEAHSLGGDEKRFFFFFLRIESTGKVLSLF